MDKLTNYRKTIAELQLFISAPIVTNRDRAGVIQAFEFTFEQSWKAIQKFAAERGSEVASPKAAFSFALQNRWIKAADELKWLQIIKDRNLTSHTYHQDLALEVIQRICKDYLEMFQGLLKELEVAT